MENQQTSYQPSGNRFYLFGSSAELVGETVLLGASPKPRNFTH
jgi:hypothetical protein